jgi:hypothetical protein
MNLPFRSSSTLFIFNEKGSAIPIVLIFSICGLIAVLAYLFFQLTIARPSLVQASSFQALLNARSGAYKAFDLLTTSPDSGFKKALSSVDTMFGEQLIDASKDTLPTITISDSLTKLQIYSAADSFGYCEVSIKSEGGFQLLNSEGFFNSKKRRVEVKIGSRIPALPDTVLVCYNKQEWEGRDPDGVKVFRDSSNETVSPAFKEIIKKYKDELVSSDSSFPELPLTIQANKDFDKIPELVKGSILIDGSYVDLAWNSNKRITVLGDIQITGKVNLTNLSLICGGEVKILDQSDLENVNIFAMARVFIGDNAVFNGDILTEKSITVYGKAIVKNKSSLVAAGSTSGGSGHDSIFYSILLSEKSVVDGVCVALNNPGSIKTDQDVQIKGILWAQNTVCHNGIMKGLIRAQAVQDCNITGLLNPPKDSTVKKNSIPGKLSPLPEIASYRMPFFVGTPSIVDWKEY